MLFRVTKLSEAPDAEQPDSELSACAPGPGRVLPVGYEAVGTLVAPIAIGAPIVLLRLVRNGIVRPRIFTSTEVKEIRLVTQNSIYRVKVVPDSVERLSSSFRPS